jgi:phosphopantothenoylcysteine decarboxylase/phosphopantothenate--cysteine ligase
VLVGFAAETGPDALAHAREKRGRKGLDAVVLNDVSRPDIGFETPDNEVTVVTADGEIPIPRATKREIARAILAAVLSRASSSAINVVTESHGAA